MERDKYFAEITRILAKDGIKTAPIDNGRLPILLNGQSIGRVEPNGTMCLAPDDHLTMPGASYCYFHTSAVANTVNEYMTAMETASILHADGLAEEFKLLSEFNGTVLAGREMANNYGMKFVTWDWSYGKTGLYQGHYHLDDYAAAKEDFAERAGLIAHNRLFSKEQLVEMYCCMSDTIDSECELSDRQIELIKKAQEQIEYFVPDLQERVIQARPQFEQTMQFGD